MREPAACADPDGGGTPAATAAAAAFAACAACAAATAATARVATVGHPLAFAALVSAAHPARHSLCPAACAIRRRMRRCRCRRALLAAVLSIDGEAHCG